MNTGIMRWLSDRKRKLLNAVADRSDVLRIERNRVRDLSSENARLNDKVSSLMQEVGTFTDRFVKHYVEEKPSVCSPRRMYRSCVEISMHELQLVLEHGNDQRLIDFMGEHIGRCAAKAIRECNTIRIR